MARKRDIEVANMIGRSVGEKMDQVEDAIRRDGDKTRAEYKAAIGEVKQVVDIIIDDLSDREKKELYDLNTIVDIGELEDSEKEFLVAVLFTLSNMTDAVSGHQQTYLRSVKSYLGIKNVQTDVNLSYIENIDSKRQTRAFLQTVMEFLFLENCTHDYLDEYEDVIDYFDVKSSEIRKIEKNIGRIYNATGAAGLAEKYGFVPEDDNDSNEVANDYYPLSAQIADMVSVKMGRYHKVTAKFSGYRIETNNYVVYERNSQILCIDKRTSSQTVCLPNENWSLTTAWYHDSILLHKADGNICILDLLSNNRTDVYLSGYSSNGIWMTNNYIVYRNRNYEMQCVDIQNSSTWIIYGVRDSTFNVRDVLLLDGKMYFLEDDGIMIDGLLLVEYDFANRAIKALHNFENTSFGQLHYRNECIYVVVNENIPYTVSKELLKVYMGCFNENYSEYKEIAALDARFMCSYHFSRCGKLIYIDPNYNLCIWNIENGEKLTHKISEVSEYSIFLLGSFIYYEKEENVYRVSLTSNEQSIV